MNAWRDYEAEGGEEIKIFRMLPNVSISIPIIALAGDESNEDEATTCETAEEKTIITGDPKAHRYDEDYNCTITTIKEPGKVVLQTQTTSFFGGADETGKGLTHAYNPTVPAEGNHMITAYDPIVRPQSKEEVPAIKDGYDYVYIGSDQLSQFWSAHVETAAMDSYLTETPVFTDEVTGESYYVGANYNVFKRRGLIVLRYYFPGRVVEGEFPARYDSIQQFVISNANAQLATTYCAWRTGEFIPSLTPTPTPTPTATPTATPTPTPEVTPYIDLPPTGDDSHSEWWLLPLGCSVCVMLGLLSRRRRQQA